MPHPSIALRRAASDDITDRHRQARSDRAAVAAEAGAAGLKPSAASTAAAAAAAAAAATAGRHMKHSQSSAPGRASAPLHASDASLFDGGVRGYEHLAAAASSSGASSSGILAAAATASSGPTAAALAANARAVSLQQYSGLPMVTPPGGNAAAAWLPDIEQQLGGVVGGGGGSSIGTGGTPRDTPRDVLLMAGSASSNSPRSSRAASPGPFQHPGGRPAAAAPAAAGIDQAGSYVGELPYFPSTLTHPQQQQAQQQQQPQVLLAHVLGGSAPVMPLAASLLDEDPDEPLLRDVDEDGEQGLSHHDATDSPVSPVHLQQALQHHIDLQKQQQRSPGKPSKLDPAQQQQQHVSVPVKQVGGFHRTGSTASAAATSVTAAGGSVFGDEEGKEAAESLADVFVEVIRGAAQQAHVQSAKGMMYGGGEGGW